MRIKVGDTTKKVYFIAVDSTDGFTRETGITTWTVYYSLNGGTLTQLTTPTIMELSATNAPGVYCLSVNASGMVASAGELLIHISATGVKEIDRIVEIVDNFEKDIYDIVNNDTYGNSALNNDLDAIKAKTDQLTFTTANRVDATAVAVNDKTGYSLSSDQSGVTIGTVNALGTQAKADVNAEVDASIVDYGLDHLLYTSVSSTDVANNSVIAKLASKADTASWSTYNNTTDSLEAIADSGGGGPTAEQIADAVWDEQLSGHQTSGSAGKALSDAGAGGDPWSTELPGSYPSGSAGYILGNRLDATVSSRAPASTALSNEVWTNEKASYLDTSISSRGSSSDVQAIKAKTDQLTFSTTNRVDATALAVADKTGYSLSSDQSGVTIGTVNNLGANAVDAIWDETKTGHNTTDSYGKIVGDNLDTTISSRAPESGGNISAIKAKTDQLTFTTANRVDATAVAVSDKTGYSLSADQSSVTIGTVNALGTQAKADVEAECGDALNIAFDDSTSLTTNSLKDRIRTLTWILRNKLVITKSTGDGVLYKDDSSTIAFTVTALVTDDSTYVIRKRLQ